MFCVVRKIHTGLRPWNRHPQKLNVFWHWLTSKKGKIPKSEAITARRWNFWGCLIVAIVYCLLLIKIIGWGIPEEDHPYTYHMDEWHQLNSVRAVFQHGTPNVEGAAYGPFLQFVLSGFYLGFWTLLGVVNPFLVKSGLIHLSEIRKIFLLLRFNTLLFGLLSIFLFAKICQKLKLNPFLGVFLFVFNPLFLSLSNYFKYDIALLFWLCLTFYSFLLTVENFTSRNYFWSCFFAALAVATKISALPLLPLLVYLFFLGNFNKKKDFSFLLKGLGIFSLTFCLFGVPYLFYGRGNFGNFFSSNLIEVPRTTGNYLLGLPWGFFLLFSQIPTLFGYSLSGLSWFSLVFLLFFSRPFSNIEKLTLAFLAVFAFSLFPLKIFWTNRALVLLPFLVLLICLADKKVGEKGLVTTIFLIVLMSIQLFQSLAWWKIKFSPDPRKVSSVWILKNIAPGNTFGIESIPIYQMLPDIVLKEYSLKEAKIPSQTTYNYQVIVENSPSLPSLVIITNPQTASFQKVSPKKDLLLRLKKEGYVLLKEFSPDWQWYKIFGDELNFFVANLVPVPTIDLYFQPKDLKFAAKLP